MRVFLGLLFCVGMPFASQAGFVGNYGKWRELSEPVKVGYVMAMWDHAEGVGSDDAETWARLEGLRKCATAVSPTPEMLIEAMDKHYAADTSRWSLQAAGIFYQSVVLGVCGKFVAEARKARGLKAVQP